MKPALNRRLPPATEPASATKAARGSYHGVMAALSDYITLGRSGLRVSPLCLGTMTFGGDWGWGSSVETACDIMDAFEEAGGNFIDTANIYTKGHSEKIIGNHLGRHASRRHRWVIATKFMGNIHPGDPNRGGAGRKNILSSVEDSLRRLQTDFIDLLWMHWHDRHTPIEETMRTLDDLVRAGKVRHIGFSDTPAWRVTQAQLIAQFRGWTPLIALQVEYSLLERTVEGELLPMARELGLGVTPWSPLKGGVLSGKYARDAKPGTDEAGRGDWVTAHLHDRTFDVLDVLRDVAARVDSTPARVALAWVTSRAGVASPIIGARTMSQLRENLECLGVKLGEAELNELDEATKPSLNFPHDFLTFAAGVSQGGTTVNGVKSQRWPLAPANDEERH
jgi:aryl-alcohol dehydrogenase-like predicted oxidoreductase